jgi:hypothetical protein
MADDIGPRKVFLEALWELLPASRCTGGFGSFARDEYISGATVEAAPGVVLKTRHEYPL